jgi:hypothetical protein
MESIIYCAFNVGIIRSLLKSIKEVQVVGIITILRCLEHELREEEHIAPSVAAEAEKGRY